MQFIQDKTFIKQDFTASPLPKAEYDNCTFTGCIFDGADISGIIFTECEFDGCNLSMGQVKGTSLKNVGFTNCKMLGFNFQYCDPFLLEVSFTECILQLCSFYRLKLKNTAFSNCDLREADFTEADLTNAVLQDCELRGAVFQNTVLEKADLRTARNYSIDPDTNRIKKAKFSKDGIAGLLDKYQVIIE